MPTGLLARLVQLGQRLQRCPALRLSLHGNASIGFSRAKIFAHVERHAPGHFAKDTVERDGLSRQHPARKSQIALRRCVGFLL
ncbi:hypothetical protein [Sphingomonas sp.]|uniref:hypothetical protein n=1 Tax=Sphingomonas sp. TaxID=28214 RepID=UPI0035A87054